MIEKLRRFFEFLWLYLKGFQPVEFVRGNDRISLHPFGWRANGTGRMKRAKDAVAYLDSADAEQWRQIYCGMTPFLVSDKGNVKHIDGRPAKLFLSNGRYQILYKPEDSRGRGRNGRDHKKRVYRAMLVAMAFLDFKKGDETHEIHHVNGYRTDDRLANLLVLTHEDHTRIHNMGPCGLSGTRDDALAMLAESSPITGDKEKKSRRGRRRTEGAADEKPAPAAAATTTSSKAPDVIEANAGEANSADTADTTQTPLSDCETETERPAKKRRRGRRGGRNRRRPNNVPTPEAQPIQTDGPSSKTIAAETDTPAAKDALAADDTPASPRNELQESASAPAVSPALKEPPAKTLPEGAEQEREKATEQPRPSSASGNTEKGAARSRAEKPVDWAEARAKLENELARFLDSCNPESSAELPSEKQLTKQCKPVYRALRPYQACPDPIDQFDAVLACIRMIAQAESDWKKSGPAPLQSLLGELHQLLKAAVKSLSAGDEIERACTEELLRSEMEKPLYAKSTSSRKLRQCLSIACSRKSRAGESEK